MIIEKATGELYMIKYDKLWALTKKKDISQYKLLNSGISHSTMQRLKKNQSVNTETIDKLCMALNCRVQDIMEYVAE